MLSNKKSHSSILLGFLMLLAGCQSQVTDVPTFPEIDVRKTPLMHYAFIGTLDEAPVHFPEVWNHGALRQLNLKHITLYTKGGKNPEDTLDKFEFDYSSDWHSLKYAGFRYEETPTAWSIGHLSFDEPDSTGTIEFSKQFGIGKNTRTRIVKNDTGYLFLRERSGKTCDTTWLIGSLEVPVALVSKIGNSLFSVELFLPESSGTKSIKTALYGLPFKKEEIQNARCSVVFIRGKRPRSAYLLNDQCSQVSLIKSWTYTPKAMIASYQEWSGNSLIREMNWEYNNSQLPASLTVDRKTYFCHYSE